MNERLPGGLDRLVPDITSEADSPTVASFLRGLALGALVGAAIAGSALLQRRRNREEEAPRDEEATREGPESAGEKP